MEAFKYGFKFVVLISLTCFVSACSSSRVVSPSSLKLTPDYCLPSRNFSLSPDQQIYFNTDSLLAHEPALIGELTKKEILTANATGSIGLLNKLAGLMQDSLRQKKLFLEYTIDIEKNIALVRGEVDELSAALDCEIIRCRELSNYLAGLTSRRNTKLTVGAIIVGAATTITPVFVTQTVPQNIVLISGGVISAGLGLLTLNPKGKQIKYVTAGNLLSDIWFGTSDSGLYAPSVWYILNEPAFSNSGTESKRLLIRERWINFDLGGIPDKQTEELMFGSGGLFDQTAFDTRVSMLTDVKSHVNSMRKDLDVFNYSLNNLKIKVIRKYEW